MPTQLAIPLRPNSGEEAMKLHDLALREKPDYLELWCDRLDLVAVQKFLSQSKLPLILNLKDESEQGDFRGSDLERIEFLLQLVKFNQNVRFVDLPLALAVKYWTSHLSGILPIEQLLVSYHNFQTTLDEAGFLTLTEPLKSLPTGYHLKLATAVNSEEDLTSLLRFYLNHQLDFGGRLFVLGMGELGRPTRIMAPLLGMPLTFAALDSKNTTAPGQLTSSELREFWNSLKF
ncbi:type I 3-dehydroquinate dehydratase [Candidatus Gracilibacteria bacterium]|nr:type I 3-dehydroquinate dehydratase [Candidatus Gracilibacteria bacterium]